MTHPMMIKWLGLALVLLHAGGHVQATGDECWTSWFDRDDPSGTGDYETLYELYKEYPGKICEHPKGIEVRTILGESLGSTANVIQASDTHTGFICSNADQPYNWPCQDYKVRFLCPLEFCKPAECWTPWFDQDDPSGTGDYETLYELHKEYPGKICERPSRIEVITTSGASVESTGNVIQVSDAHTGFICQNTDQPCADYKVRFMCPLEFCKPTECWTPWINRDSPGGFGDYETLPSLLKEYPDKICEYPTGIEARTVSGASVESTGNAIHAFNTENGFICRNTDQHNNWPCADYEVRFSCPLEFCRPAECWTPWMNRDSPGGFGDYETLSDLQKENPGKVCEHPIGIEARAVSGASVASTGNVIQVSDTRTGFICRNVDQPYNWLCADYEVRFSCPLEFCEHEVCKTSWFNQDKPSGTGDYEILDKIFAENPGEMCRLPLGIEAQTVDGKPSTSTGDTIAVVDTETGLICRNSDQMNGRCSDYKVRFICPLDFCGTKE
ncbi:mucin-5AC-like [Syngnathus scovelli]|uniref:mucin-5AC-like n=1 Tax=Syngnathus scovelli TaxID=161590 RepID=UPI00210F5A3B|nr:uncharacterized protein LOC125972244 isoform X1 [Syngnathus scovelli]